MLNATSALSPEKLRDVQAMNIPIDPGSKSPGERNSSLMRVQKPGICLYAKAMPEEAAMD